MAKIVYSAYNKFTSEYDPSTDSYISGLEPITDDYSPFDDSSSGWTKLLYLASGTTIAKGGDVTLYRSNDAVSAYLPDSSIQKVGKDFINAENVTISNGGKLYLGAGAIASGTVISGSRSVEKVEYTWSFTPNNGEADPAVRAESYDAQIYSGGIQTVAGGYTYGTVIHSGGTQTVSGGLQTKIVQDENGEYYTKSASAQGIAEHTIIHEGGKQIVKTNGIVYNTKVNGGTLDISNASAYDTNVKSGTLKTGNNTTLCNTTISQNANVSIGKGTKLESFLFIAKTITINSGVNTDDLAFCFDLSGMTDRNLTILNKSMYDNLSEKTEFYITNDISQEMIDSGTNTFSYSIINVGSEFDRSITILNVTEDIDGSKTYIKGNLLKLNEATYDIYGNSYTLKYNTDNSVYTVDFVNNTTSNFAEFKQGQAAASCSFYAKENDSYGLYSVHLDICDTENSEDPLSATERIVIFKSLSGTIKIYDNNVLIGTQTVEDGIISGAKVLIPSVAENQLYYVIELKNNTNIDKAFRIKVSMTNNSLNNINNEDNLWQALETPYIFTFSRSDSRNISNEYAGFNDNIDYRRLDLSRAGTLKLSGDFLALNNVANSVSVTVYQAISDGSKLKKVISVSGSIIDAQMKLDELLLNAGTYYIEVKANDKNYIRYELNANITLFDRADASNPDDTAAKTSHYIKNSVNIADSYTEWVGPGDTVDYRKINVEQAGKYTVTLNKNLAEDETNDSILKLEIVEVYNGKEKVVSKQTIKADINEYTTKDFYISPIENAEYFIRVLNTNAAKNNDIEYTITFNGTTFNADTSDELPENAAVVTIDENGYLVTIDENGDLVTKDYYIGYGDLTDYYQFDITQSGEYSFTVESTIKSGAKVTIYRLYDDGKLGTVPLQSVINCNAPANYNLKERVYYSDSKNVTLMEGTYFIKVTGGSKTNDSKNAEYSIKLNGKAFDSFADFEDRQYVIGQNVFEKGKTYTITVTDNYMSIKSDLFKQFTITRDNGKNKTTKITTAYETILAPGTYYFTANQDISSTKISTGVYERYQISNITDNNSWKNASVITTEGVQKQWVGYGDGIDYYKYTVTADNTGKNVITLSHFLPDTASITLYYVKTDSKGVQSLAKASYKIKDNVITADNLIAGDYYIAVNSKSYSNAANAMNTNYNVSITAKPYKKLSNNITERTSLANKEYAVIDINSQNGGIFYANFKHSEKYTLYKNNGNGGLVKVATFNDTALLDSNEIYYIQSNADNNRIVYTTASTVKNNPENKPSDSRWWLGLNDAADSYEFDTFGSEGAMTLFTLNNISDTVSANTKFTVTLYQEVNGAWKKVSSANASYNANTLSETAANLSANLAADSKYKIEVSTSDKGAGTCAGYFDFTQQSFAYDYSNNSFQSATVLEDTISAVVAKKGDTMDIYEFDGSKNFNLVLDTGIDAKAAVKLTFYDENYNVVKISSNGKSAANLTLNAKDNDFSMSALSEDIKFVKVEAAGSGINSYTITQDII